MIGTLSRFTDDEIPLGTADAAATRAFFSVWATELAGGST